MMPKWVVTIRYLLLETLYVAGFVVYAVDPESAMQKAQDAFRKHEPEADITCVEWAQHWEDVE